MGRKANFEPMRRTGLPAALLAAAWLAVEAAAALVGVSFAPVPAQAQYFDFFSRPPDSYQQRYRPQQQRGFGFGFFGGGNWNYQQYDPWAPPPPRRVERPPRVERPQLVERPQEDFSKAPPPPRKEAEPAISVLVLGDSMADWLAYGLEDAFSDTPELGVTRRHRTGSGLLRSEGRDAYDWVQGAKDVLARDKADFVVMMIGLGDRHPIRERQPARANQPAGQKPGEPAKPSEAPKANDPAKPAEAAKPAETAKAGRKSGSRGARPRAARDRAPGVSGRPGTLVSYEFRSDKWVELYSRRIDETIAALKAKRVPVIWVGLPPIRGTRPRAELSFLNEMYKARAEKAGIVYVDVWDGFMDESGEFSNFGPDILGQNRRLRAGDGVHFTKAGARKLAHYVEREIRRLLSRATPVALPVPDEPQKPSAVPQPSGPAPRPVAGPVVPLTGHTPAAERLLGSAGQGNFTADSVAVRVLVKGEPVEAPTGRADNFAWPRTDGAVEDQIEPAEPIATAQPPRPVPPTAARAALPRAGQRPPAQAATPQRRGRCDRSSSRAALRWLHSLKRCSMTVPDWAELALDAEGFCSYGRRVGDQSQSVAGRSDISPPYILVGTHLAASTRKCKSGWAARR